MRAAVRPSVLARRLWGVMALRRSRSRDEAGNDDAHDPLLDQEFKQFIYGGGRVTSAPHGKELPPSELLPLPEPPGLSRSSAEPEPPRAEAGGRSPEVLGAGPDDERTMGLIAVDIADLRAEVERLSEVAEYAVTDAVRARDELSVATQHLQAAQVRVQTAEAEAARVKADEQLARTRATEAAQELERALHEIVMLRADVDQAREQAQAAAADSAFVRNELDRRDAEISTLRAELAERARVSGALQRRDERLGQAVAAARDLTNRIDRRIADAR